MKAEIITIGDEILRGEIVDSNKARIAERLLLLDVETHFQVSVRDHPEDMRHAFRTAADRADVVVVSGGLGPTRDDRTAEVIAATFGRKLIVHGPSVAAIRRFFERAGRPMADTNLKQAMIPEGAEVLPNPVGTAPGFTLRAGRARFFCLPGVPRELDRMLEEQVLPRIEADRAAAAGQGSGRVVRARLLRTFGIGESDLEALVSDIARRPPAGGVEVELGFRTSFPDNLLRPVVRAPSAGEAEAALERLCRELRTRLGALVYGEGEQTLEAVVVRELARAAPPTRPGRPPAWLAVAESCTGGLLAERITSVPGASAVFRGGVVAYSNEAKRDLLGVPADLLERHGAVSDPVVRAMAAGALGRFAADLAVAITGISGPTGGTPEKPVGLVHIALARSGPTGTSVDTASFVFPFDRARHRRLTVQVALDWIRRALLGVDLALPRWAPHARGGTAQPRAPAAGSTGGAV